MDRHVIFAVHITNRLKHVADVQAVLTEFGCTIKTRLGLHETSKEQCSPNGLLILELLDDPSAVAAFESKLQAIEGVELKKVVFDHP
jgi:hypothetical protein